MYPPGLNGTAMGKHHELLLHMLVDVANRVSSI